jgi:hypothetical protein
MIRANQAILVICLWCCATKLAYGLDEVTTKVCELVNVIIPQYVPS